jgi:glycine oxidase
MNLDCIVVGFGLAGMALVKQLEDNDKSFVVFEDASQTSSNVAGGVYNPVILKRFTPVWKGTEQINYAIPFYKELEAKFHKKYDYTFDTYRVFKSIEEQNNWFAASDKPLLAPYMDTQIVTNKFRGIISENGFGRLHKTGRIDTKNLLDDYKVYLEKTKRIIYDTFDYESIVFNDPKISYKNISSITIVFCEGFGMHKNPYFKDLPLNEVKGELLTIHAPLLDADFLIKSAVFVLPLGNHYFKVGATFNWTDKTSTTTEEAKFELLSKLDSFINVPYEVVHQSAGVRPTVKDRRPLVGRHPVQNSLVILNGLGTRGVMIAPTLAAQLYQYLFENASLDQECDIARFYK